MKNWRVKRGFMKCIQWIVAGSLVFAFQPLAAQEKASGLVGEYWQMQAEELGGGTILIQDFPIITNQKPVLSRADGTVDIDSTTEALPGTSLADNFYIRWTGKIRIAQEGDYTFYTESDDGSRLSINGNPIVGNGGLHGAQEASGTLNLKPGDHDILIEYFDATFDALMKVSWSSPAINREIIPAKVLWHKAPGKDELQTGLWGEYFDFSNGFPQPPANRKADLKRVDRTLNFDKTEGDFGNTTLSGNFFARWSGTLRVPKAGKYKFYTESDDGSRLLINGQQIVNNGGPHGMQEVAGEIELPAGEHKIVIEYYDIDGEAGLKASWSGPDLEKAIISEDYLSHPRAAE
jgi:hypothetical protein